MSKITEGGLSRRQFLTGSALTAGAVASLGLAGCAPKAPTEAPATGESDLAATGADGTTVRAHAAQLNPQSDPKPVSNTTCPSLFTEWKMGSLTLPNRVVKSAAGYIGVTSQGITGDLHMQHYGKLAAGGASVVYCDDFAELYDHFRAIPDVGKFTDWTDEDLTAFANNIKENGAKAGYQLATMGLVFSGFEPDPTAIFQSSDCMDMTAEEISNLIADTIKAAATLKRCGFDCVEVNAAGENVGQTFMSRNRNKREDDYGPQTFESRTRFVCEIVRGIKAECGEDFPVQVLINGVSRRTTRPSATTPFSLPLKRTKRCASSSKPPVPTRCISASGPAASTWPSSPATCTSAVPASRERPAMVPSSISRAIGRVC